MTTLDIEEAIEISAALRAAMRHVAEVCGRLEGVQAPAFAHVLITGDEEIHQINLAQRGVDRPTDVLSFPTISYRGKTLRDCEKLLRREMDADVGACFLGDIVISLPRAKAQGEEYGHGAARETLYLTAHGLFHLMGYDHMNDDERAAMRAMEEKAMNEAGYGRVPDEELIEKAKQAAEFAYVPYSRFQVGACLLTDDGRLYTGCNIENASYGGTNCAERTAVFKAVSEGARRFTAIAIYNKTALPWPCGICRQVLNEFAPHLRVLVATNDERDEARLDELLPHSFGPSTGTDEYLLR